MHFRDPASIDVRRPTKYKLISKVYTQTLLYKPIPRGEPARTPLVNPESPIACTNVAKVGYTAYYWPCHKNIRICSRLIRPSPTAAGEREKEAVPQSWSSFSSLHTAASLPNASTNTADRHPPGHLRLHLRPAHPPQQTTVHPALFLMD